MDSTFSRIDNLLDDVDRFLGENKLSSDDESQNSSSDEKSTPTKHRFSSPIEQTRNDINELLRRANIEPTSTSCLPKNFKYSAEDDNNQNSENSFQFKDTPSTPGSPSYDFMQSRAASKAARNPSLSSPQLNQPPNTFQSTPLPEPTKIPPQPASRTYNAYIDQSAAQIEIEMLTNENAKLVQELQQYQKQLQTVVQKNSSMLKQIEQNEMELYSLRSKRKV